MATCASCGREEDDPARLLVWSTGTEAGRSRSWCDTCSRAHLRAIEGKLDSAWW